MARRIRKNKISKNKKFSMSIKNIEEMRREARIVAVRITNTFPLFILKDKFKFGEKRLKQFQMYYADAWDLHNDRKLDIIDIAKKYKVKYDLEIINATDTTHKFANEDSNKNVTLRKRDINAIEKRALSDAIQITKYIPLYVLVEHYKFGEKRLKRFLKHYNNLIEAYEEKYVTINDIEQTLIKENNVHWDWNIEEDN